MKSHYHSLSLYLKSRIKGQMLLLTNILLRTSADINAPITDIQSWDIWQMTRSKLKGISSHNVRKSRDLKFILIFHLSQNIHLRSRDIWIAFLFLIFQSRLIFRKIHDCDWTNSATIQNAFLYISPNLEVDWVAFFVRFIYGTDCPQPS